MSVCHFDICINQTNSTSFIATVSETILGLQIILTYDLVCLSILISLKPMASYLWSDPNVVKVKRIVNPFMLS
jgi:hypothetical protein